MKKILVILLLISITFINAENKKLGKEITIKEKTPISKILSAPDKFTGKAVLVEGKILSVCEESGCWIEIAGSNKNEKIKVKVEDGVIVFPKDSKGKTVLVQGTVAPVEDEACSPSESSDCETTCKSKSGCSSEKAKKVYQIEGIGAVIK